MKTYERTAFARSGPRLRRYRAALVSAAAIGTVVASSVGAQTVLPKADGTGQTQVGPTMAQSAPPQWPELAKAPSGAPNILLIMTDDVGFGATSSFGGPIPTPVLDRLADNGIRYNRFNTTALCSPTRAALLTGRNHHNTNTAVIGPGFRPLVVVRCLQVGGADQLGRAKRLGEPAFALKQFFGRARHLRLLQSAEPARNIGTTSLLDRREDRPGD